jgi:hypothetical protein
MSLLLITLRASTLFTHLTWYPAARRAAACACNRAASKVSALMWRIVPVAGCNLHGQQQRFLHTRVLQVNRDALLPRVCKAGLSSMNSLWLAASTRGAACAEPLSLSPHVCVCVPGCSLPLQQEAVGARRRPVPPSMVADRHELDVGRCDAVVTSDLPIPGGSGPVRSRNGAAAVHWFVSVVLLHVQVQLQAAVHRPGRWAAASFVALTCRGAHCPQAGPQHGSMRAHCSTLLAGAKERMRAADYWLPV